jgi:hypothetical protein
MSGDMMIESFYEVINDNHDPIFFAGQPEERMRPDWARGHREINNLCDEMMLNNKIDPNVMHLGDEGLGEIKDLPQVREKLHKYLTNIELAYTSQRGSLVALEFFPYRVWITGGQSWGDTPTDLYYPVEVMNQLSVLDAVGFNPVLPDYRKMFNAIVKDKNMQPLLIGLDPYLDRILEKEFKNAPHHHKRKVNRNPSRPPSHNKADAKAGR